MMPIQAVSQALFNVAGFKVPPEKVTQEALQLTVETLGATTALVSTVGFTVGGVGMAYETLHDKFSKQASTSDASLLTPRQGQSEASSNSTGASLPIKIYALTPREALQGDASSAVATNPSESDKAKPLVHTLEPKTKFGKTALNFAKVGVGFSGITGVFNGLAMGFPLMAVGEGLNVAASPIIQTPTGMGLFFMGLASVFASRALEKDERYKMQPKDLLNPGKVVTNIAGNLGVLVDSSKKVAGKAAHLLVGSSAEKEASRAFFLDEVFNLQPQSLDLNVIGRKVGSGAETILTRVGTRNSPYLMHSASLLLGLGGAVLTASSLLKQKQGQYVGLKTAEVGGSLDNLGLSKYGLERVAQGERLPGGLLAASGVTIMAGQPGMDKPWGRAFQWLGCGLLFSVFVVDRLKGLTNVIDRLKKPVAEEVSEHFKTLEPKVLNLRYLLPEGTEASFGNLRKAYGDFRAIESALGKQGITDWKAAPKEAFAALPKLYDAIQQGVTPPPAASAPAVAALA